MVRGTFDDNGSSPIMYGNGDVKVIVVSGTFGGGTLNLEVTSDNEDTWVVDSGFALLAGDILPIRAPRGMPFRLTLSGATTPDINWAVY